jgi:hypothetical protein
MLIVRGMDSPLPKIKAHSQQGENTGRKKQRAKVEGKFSQVRSAARGQPEIRRVVS